MREVIFIMHACYMLTVAMTSSFCRSVSVPAFWSEGDKDLSIHIVIELGI